MSASASSVRTAELEPQLSDVHHRPAAHEQVASNRPGPRLHRRRVRALPDKGFDMFVLPPIERLFLPVVPMFGPFGSFFQCSDRPAISRTQTDCHEFIFHIVFRIIPGRTILYVGEFSCSKDTGNSGPPRLGRGCSELMNRSQMGMLRPECIKTLR